MPNTVSSLGLARVVVLGPPGLAHMAGEHGLQTDLEAMSAAGFMSWVSASLANSGGDFRCE